MKPAILWLIFVGALILAYAFYQSRRSSNDLDVEPRAAKEIEKAKRQ